VLSEILDIPMLETEKPRIRIRGIYSTALTKFFLENDFQIVQPSRIIAERFGLNNSFFSPHIDVFDKENRHGLNIESLSKYTDMVVSLLFQKLPAIIIRKSKVQLSAVYKGIVLRPAPRGGFIIKLTPTLEGWLPMEEIKDSEVGVGDTILVEVKDPKSTVGIPRVSTNITIPGDYAVLIPEEVVRVSHKIRGDVRMKLLEIGKVLRPDGWGIIWRTSAYGVEIEVLQQEIEKLAKEADKLITISMNAPALMKIRKGLDLLDVEIPFESKIQLDNLRSSVCPTVRYHHWLKTLNEQIVDIVDFSEKYLSKYTDIGKINTAIDEYIQNELLVSEGRRLKIHHIKISGKEIILGPARVIIEKGNGIMREFRLFRHFRPGGYYDGIGENKEVGDYGITIVKLGDSKLITSYFSINNNLKGIYLNINTPIEATMDGFRYIDLELDVIVNSSGAVQIIDAQKLKNYVEEGIISESLFNKTLNLAEQYSNWLENGGIDEIIKKCEEVRAKIVEIESSNDNRDTEEFTDNF